MIRLSCDGSLEFGVCVKYSGTEYSQINQLSIRPACRVQSVGQRTTERPNEQTNEGTKERTNEGTKERTNEQAKE